MAEDGKRHQHSNTLKGRVALVTGASRGIGRAIALELATTGASVAINFRTSADSAEQVAAEVRELGADCIVIQGDVSREEEARIVIRAVLDAWKRVDILVNNAGITRDRSLRKMAPSDWADVINVNLNGTYFCTSAALPAMIEQKYGRIINITSMIGQIGGFGQANYAASKGGIVAFTKTLALEMARYNITANALAPGYTSTEMVGSMPKEVLDQIKAKIPLGRLARPEEIADGVAFLACADYITGTELSINGGLHM